jgi:hypothetical protein
VLQITDLRTAGTFPAIDSRGEWIYLSVLGAEGWDLARIPYDPGTWFPPLPTLERFVAPPAAGANDGLGLLEMSDPLPYSAFSTVLPRYWLPIYKEDDRVADRRVLREGWGFKTSGADLLERHRYDAWVAGLFSGDGTRIEWSARYRWAGLGNPHLWLESGQEWDAQPLIRIQRSGIDLDSHLDSLLPLSKERYYGGAAELRRQGVRQSLSLTL